ncbi:MAG: RHS repeat-associated core domain-containing protein [Planctomycetes bacterium]|nr:RHS repeat-associated core domain-containing protein [Planctomycetota bacterium]
MRLTAWNELARTPRRWLPPAALVFLLLSLGVGRADSPADSVRFPNDAWPYFQRHWLDVPAHVSTPWGVFSGQRFWVKYGPVPDRHHILHAIGWGPSGEICHLTTDPATRSISGWSVAETIFREWGTTQVEQVALAVDADDAVHAIWLLQDVEHNPQALYYSCKATGAAWSAPLQLNLTQWKTEYETEVLLNSYLRCPRIGLDASGRVHVAWAQVIYSDNGAVSRDAVYHWSGGGRVEVSKRPLDPVWMGAGSVLYVTLLADVHPQILWMEDHLQPVSLSHMTRVWIGSTGLDMKSVLSTENPLRPGNLVRDSAGQLQWVYARHADGGVLVGPIDPPQQVIAQVPPLPNPTFPQSMSQPVLAVHEDTLHLFAHGWWANPDEHRLLQAVRTGQPGQWSAVATHRRAPDLDYYKTWHSFAEADANGNWVIGTSGHTPGVQVERDLGAYAAASMVGTGPGTAANPVNGNLVGSVPLFAAQGVGPSLSLGLTYNSLDFQPGPLGAGWTHTFDVYATWGADGAVIHWGDGRVSVPGKLRASGVDGKFSARFSDELYGHPLYFVTLDGTRYDFREDGKLNSISDPNGNSLRLRYDDNGMTADKVEANLVAVQEEASGRSIGFEYDKDNRIRAITDPANKRYTLTYDNSGHLASVVFEGAHDAYAMSYYAASGPYPQEGGPRVNLLESFTTPAGRKTTFRYRRDNRLASAENQYPETNHRRIQFDYGQPGGTSDSKELVNVTDRCGATTTYECDLALGVVKKVTDPPILMDGASAATRYSVSWEHDDFGNVKSETNRRGFTTSYEYAYEHRADSGGSPWERSLVAKSIRPGEAVTRTTYFGGEPDVDARANHVKTVTEPVQVEGQEVVTEYELDDRGNVTTVYAPDNRAKEPEKAQRFARDARGRVVTAMDPKGTTTYGYDDGTLDPAHCGLATAVQRGDRKAAKTGYDAMGNTVLEVTPEGAETANELDERYRVKVVQGPQVAAGRARTETSYDGDGRVLGTTELGMRHTTHMYASDESKVTTTHADEKTTVTELDPNGNARKTTDGEQNVTTRTYDAVNQVSVVNQETLGLKLAYFRDPNGNATTTQETSNAPGYDAPVTRTWHTEFDERDNPTKETLPPVTVWTGTGNRIDTITVHGGFRKDDTRETWMRKVNDAFVAAGSTLFDLKGRAAKRTRQVGEQPSAADRTAESRFDDNDNVVRSLDPLGNGPETQFDDANLPERVTDGAGGEARPGFDDDGRRKTLKVPNPLGSGLITAETLGFAADGAVTSSKDAHGVAATAQYDLDGNLDSATDRGGNTTSCTRDKFGRVTEVRRQPASGVTHVTTIVYDDTARTKSVTNPRGKTWVYEYDRFWRLKKITNPPLLGMGAGKTHTFEYHPWGGVLKETDEAGRTIEYFYDELHRLVKEVRRGHNGEGPVYESKRSYDATNRLTSIELLTTPHGGNEPELSHKETHEYNDVSRTETMTSFIGGAEWRRLVYRFDKAGRRVEVTGPQEEVFAYDYDSRNLLTEIRRATALVVHYFYDTGGRRTGALLGNGIRITYKHDAKGRLTRQFARNAAGETLASISYVYDRTDRRVEYADSLEGLHAVFEYNKVGWLKSETWNPGFVEPFENEYTDAEPGNESAVADGETAVATPRAYTLTDSLTATYENDGAGNRSEMVRNGVQTTYVHDNDNRLLSFLTDGVQTTYLHDDAGNPIQIIGPDGTSALSYDNWNHMVRFVAPDGSGANYRYGATGERLSKRLLGASATEWYAHDGRDVIADYTKADGAATYDLVAQYANGLGIDQKLALYLPSGDQAGAHFYLTNPIGSVTHVTGAAGAVESRYITDAWGVPLVDEAGAVPSRYGFTGRERDAESGLMHYRARAYDPRLGSFHQGDPARHGSNWYGYCSNDPLGKTDPMGLREVSDADRWAIYKLRHDGAPEDEIASYEQAIWLAGASESILDYTDCAGRKRWGNELWLAKYRQGRSIASDEQTSAPAEHFIQPVTYIRNGATVIVVVLAAPASASAFMASGTAVAAGGLSTGVSAGFTGLATLTTGVVIAGEALTGTDPGVALIHGVDAGTKVAAVGQVISLGTSVLEGSSGIEARIAAAHQTQLDGILSAPANLKGMAPWEVEGMVGRAPGWNVERLRRGSRAGQGWVFREYGPNGKPTGRLLRWHPGGGHHGPDSYWRVSSGEGGNSGIIPGGGE